MDEICAADPLMRVHWSSLTRQLTCDVMGAIQLEILGALLRDRFGLEASFGPPKVVYKETVAAPGEGIAVYTMPKPVSYTHLLVHAAPAANRTGAVEQMLGQRGLARIHMGH